MLLKFFRWVPSKIQKKKTKRTNHRNSLVQRKTGSHLWYLPIRFNTKSKKEKSNSIQFNLFKHGKNSLGIELSMQTAYAYWCLSEGHQHGSRESMKTSWTRFCYESDYIKNRPFFKRDSFVTAPSWCHVLGGNFENSRCGILNSKHRHPTAYFRGISVRRA